MADLDLVVLGAGPGGYVAAIRAAQLGARVAVVDDQDRPGGVCLNWGCIPTKALLDAAHRWRVIEEAEAHGFRVGKPSFDLAKIVSRSRGIVDRLGKGIESLLKRNKVERIAGRGRIDRPGRVVVTGGGKTREVAAGRIVVATGSRPRIPKGFEPDAAAGVWTSREALLVEEVPKRLAVLGAGAIGMEFAYFFRSLGAEVTVVEMLDRVLPVEDPDISAALRRIYEKDGMRFVLGNPVEGLDRSRKGLTVAVKGGERVAADAVLVALGVVPNDPDEDDLFGPDIAVRRDAKGWIEVDDDYRTSVPGIYAIGDITGPPWLAHVASHEGIVCVERMFNPCTTGERPSINYDAIPACTYCVPQVASVGLTEPEARARHGDVRVGIFPFLASGRALAAGESEGFVKMIFDGPHRRLVGAHILGAEATEIIAELGIAYALEATAEEIVRTVHAHPTLAEAVVEATLAAEGRAIHA